MSAGASAVLSIHVGSNRSATVASARLTAEQIGVPVTVVDTGVTVVDTGTAPYIEGYCVRPAAERVTEGAGIDAAAEAAEAAGSLEDALRALPNVAAHTGAGTFGAVFHRI